MRRRLKVIGAVSVSVLLSTACVQETIVLCDVPPAGDAGDVAPDGAADLPAEAFACPGGIGCPCATDADCTAGYCASTADGMRCVQGCSFDSDCPAGSQCLAGAGGEGARRCVPPDTLCRPCSSDQECTTSAGVEGACVATGPSGSYCGIHCRGDEACPEGFECVWARQDGGPRVCRPAGGAACECTEFFKVQGFKTPCYVKNGFGTCTGERTCDGACSAAEPAAEVCNGKDDDCDGATDPEGAAGCLAHHRDDDWDGFGVDADPQCLCAPLAPYTATAGGDCDDKEAAVHPGASVCGKDGDCDLDPLDPGEECDDANAVDWDGCNACKIAEWQVEGGLTALPDGSFLAVAGVPGGDGSGEGIRGRRYHADGSPDGDAFTVNATTGGDQTAPSVAVLEAGVWIAAWQGPDQDGSGIFARRFAADGTPGPEFQVNAYSTGGQTIPHVATVPSGASLVAWHSEGQDGGGDGVFARPYAADGTPGDELQVNQYTVSEQRVYGIAGLPDGRFVVTWASWGQAGTNAYNTYARLIDADGKAVGDEFRVDQALTGDQVYSAVAVLPWGGFLVEWEGQATDQSWDIKARFFTPDGAPMGGEVNVNQATTGDQWGGSITALPDGRFLIAWTSTGQGGPSGEIWARRFAADGNPSGDEFHVNTLTDGWQAYPLVTTFPDGTTAISWKTTEVDAALVGSYALRFGPDGTKRYR